MSFSKLSLDIALVVAECLGHDRDINALARTCRSLYGLLNPVLYRHNVEHAKASALDWAVYRTETTTARYALDAGASVHKPVPHESMIPGGPPMSGFATPLNHAVCRWPAPGTTNRAAKGVDEHESFIRLLIERGAEHKGSAGADLLIVAAKNGDIRLTSLLTDIDAHDEEKNNERSTVLHFAAILPGTLVLRCLLDQGFKVNARDGAEATPLHKAAHRGNECATLLLIRFGADVNAQCEGGYTPLHFTVMNGCPCCCMPGQKQRSMIQMLLDHRADINTADEEGMTMLYPALGPNNHITIKELMDLGADIHVRDREGKTLLHEVAKFRQDFKKMIPKLAGLGVDVHTKDYRGQTALHIGALHANIESLVDLIKLGLDVNARDDSEWTPLHLVAVSNRDQSLKLLADSGADINAQDQDGYTPLHNAVECDSLEALNVLLELDVNATLKNVHGLTALDINKQSRFPHAPIIRRLLIEKTARRSTRLRTKPKKNYDETADDIGEEGR